MAIWAQLGIGDGIKAGVAAGAAAGKLIADGRHQGKDAPAQTEAGATSKDGTPAQERK